MNDRSKNIARAWIDLTLVTSSPLHIGAAEIDASRAQIDGEDEKNTLRILKGENNRAVIPGSSLRGCLRAAYQRVFTDAGDLFGCGGDDKLQQSSRLRVRSALSSESWSEESIGESLTGHARGSVSNAVQDNMDNMLYRREVVRVGVSFSAQLIVKNTSLDELSELCAVLQALHRESLGAAKRSGLGQFKALVFGSNVQVHTLRHYEIKKWLKAGANKQLHELSKPLKKLKPVVFDKQYGTTWSLNLYPQSAFHIGSGKVKDSGGYKLTCPRKSTDGRAIVPGTALKGALRAVSRRLLMSLVANIAGERLPPYEAANKVDPVISALFGSSKAAGCLWIEDFISEHRAVETQRYFNAIDRFTGGAADGKLYSLIALYCNVLRGKFHWRPPASVKDTPQECALLHLLEAVFSEAQHLIYLGGVNGRGLGEMRLGGEIDAVKSMLPSDSEGREALWEWLGIELVPRSRPLAAVDFLVQSSAPAAPYATYATEHSKNRNHIIHPYQFVNADEVSSHRQDYALLANTWRSARHDVYLPDRFTGRIICRMRLHSPLLVGAKQNTDKDPTSVECYVDPVSGELAVPGSSIRGCISSTAESISGSAMRVLDDQLLTQRANHRKPLKRLGRIQNTGQAWQLTEVETKKEKATLIGPDTFTQWHDERADELKQFKHGTHSLKVIEERDEPFSLLTGEACPVDTLAEMLRQRVLDRAQDQALDRHIYPFIPVEYMETFDYQLASAKDKHAKQAWRESFRDWIDGKLVYFKVEEKKVTLLSFSEIWREPYMVKKTHLAFRSHLLPWGSEGRVDRLLSPAEALFGVVEERARGGGEESREGPAALLASRVRFADARPKQGVNLERHQTTTLRELSSPKPPSPQMYFKKDSPSSALGRKHYASQGKPRWVLNTNLQDDDLKKKNKRCMSGQPIKAESADGDNTQFYFHVDVQNLSKEELGLLLWSLSPDGWGEEKGMGFRHKLGMAKPLGLGQIEIDVMGLWQHDPLAQLSGEQCDADFALLFEGNVVSELPSRYRHEKSLPANPHNSPIPDSSYVLEKALAELRAIGRLSSTEGYTVDYPRHRDSEKTVVDDEGFKWFELNKEQADPYHHHAPDLDKAQGLAAFPVLGPTSVTKKGSGD